MLKVFRAKFNSFMQTLGDIFIGREEVTNTYCIPCTWTITGKVYIEAPNADLAKAYVRTQKINPDMEDCYCFNISPDVEHPIVCQCGNCGNEYIISSTGDGFGCPYCENGDDM